jgi:hypothetical protein
MLGVAYTADGCGSDDFLYTVFLAGKAFLCICFGNGEQGWFSITGHKEDTPVAFNHQKKFVLWVPRLDGPGAQVR